MPPAPDGGRAACRRLHPWRGLGCGQPRHSRPDHADARPLLGCCGRGRRLRPVAGGEVPGGDRAVCSRSCGTCTNVAPTTASTAARLALAGDSGGAAMCLATTLLLRDQAARRSRRSRCTTGCSACVTPCRAGSSAVRGTASPRPTSTTTWTATWPIRPTRAARTSTASGPTSAAASPPTYLAAAELDPLLDDTAALAAILTEHGVPCSHEVFDGVLHGFLHNSRMLDAAATALGNGGAFLRPRPRPTPD